MTDALQFVRPDWFYAFVPLVLFIVLMLRRHNSSLSWKAVCDKQLLPYILTKAMGKSSRLPLLFVAITASLCIIAAAGPVFKKLPQPVFREQSSLVILVDLSQSMDATDLRPSRLERAKLKLLDILKARQGGQTALIVYAANAFVVTPLTDDSNNIANLTPSLKTQLMPAQGSHAYTAIAKAAELLRQAGATSGDVLLITDSLSSKDNEAIRTISTQGHRLSILGIGTTEGGPIPLNGGFLQDDKGAIVIPRLHPQQLQQAALKGGGIYVSLQADDSDIERLGKLFSSNKIKPEIQTLGELKLTADVWQEEGPWLLLLVIPLVALWSRKGWLLCIPVIALSLPEPAYAFDANNLWRSNDQRAMRAFDAGDVKNAAQLFENPRWKSSAYYRNGDYDKALEAINQAVSSDDYYNKGNALAQLERYPEAIKAYDTAIDLDANNEDASYNRELVKKEIQEQQGDQPQDGQPQDQHEDQQQSGEKNNQPDQSQQQDNQQNEADTQGKDGDDAQPSSEPEKNNEEEVKQALQDAQQQEQISDKENTNEQRDDDSLTMNEDDQATEQWLKRIPDDPGQLLRRKFHYQYKRMPNQVPGEQPW